VLAEPAPPAGRVYQVAMWHYARGMAFARTGRPDEAAHDLAALQLALADPAAAELMLAGDTATAQSLLAIAEAHLRGELAAARGETDAAVAALEDAVAKQDALTYMEPPPFYFPVRQALGAVLLSAGRSAEAAEVYRQDLAEWPKNGWSLYGLTQSLGAQEKTQEAGWAQEGFERAWVRADVEINASRF
jgi:tetratricopeptide (TPR) repeat protein